MGTYRFGPIEMADSFVFIFFPLAAIVLVLFYVKNKQMEEKEKANAAAAPYSLWVPKSSEKTKPALREVDVTPIQEFDLYNTPPHPFRPYKPIYHMTMGLERCHPNDLFLLDSSYPSRIALRKQLISQYPSITLGASDAVAPAVRELYKLVLVDHLPTRFPTYFQVDKSGEEFKNRITSDTHSTRPPSSPLDCLAVLATTIEEDILILKRDTSADSYRLHGFVACFPSGFDSSQKMGLTLREIHGPVPLYLERLAPSMDRFFAKLEIGKWVKRLNWTITTHDKLFVPSDNHVYVDEEVPEELESVDLEKTYLRVERQVLLRLPESRDMVFFVKTYLTKLSTIKAEGQGDALATAIEGMPEKVGFYKRRVVWGKAVTVSLRN